MSHGPSLAWGACSGSEVPRTAWRTSGPCNSEVSGLGLWTARSCVTLGMISSGKPIGQMNPSLGSLMRRPSVCDRPTNRSRSEPGLRSKSETNSNINRHGQSIGSPCSLRCGAVTPLRGADRSSPGHHGSRWFSRRRRRCRQPSICRQQARLSSSDFSTEKSRS
jgi:hypothetical protein